MSEKIYTIDELKKILASVLKNFDVKRAILFGSYAKNNPTAKSDIDLVVDSEGKLLNIYFYGLPKYKKIVEYIMIYKRRE